MGADNYKEYLLKKYQEIEETEQRWESFCTEDAEIVLVAYGISSRVSKEAVKIARAKGLKLGLIRPRTLWPYPNVPEPDIAIQMAEDMLKQYKK